MPSENIVKLNVGGTIFMTSRSTLVKFDGYFRTMLESGVPHEKDEAGCIFVDRDPKHFSLVLNFLRDGDVGIPESALEKDQILHEAQFYLLDGLIFLCGGEPSEDWKRANAHAHQETKLQVTENYEEYQLFREEFKDKHSVVIQYEKWGLVGDILENPFIKKLVEKHREKWNILLFGSYNGQVFEFVTPDANGRWQVFDSILSGYGSTQGRFGFMVFLKQVDKYMTREYEPLMGVVN